MKDCGCGNGKNCISKKNAESLIVPFIQANPSFNRKSKRAIVMFIKKELKKLDCGCGCKGTKGFKEKYLTGGGVLNDCPAGWRNDGLTCVEPCPEGMRDDGLTCRERCGPGEIDDGLTCRKPIESKMNECPEGSKDVAGTCWGPVRQDCVDDCFKHPAPGCKTYECGRLRGAFGEDWGPKLCTDCNLRCGQTCWDVQGITKQLHQRELRVWGGEVRGQRILGKRIVGRVNWDVLLKDLVQGLIDFTTGKLDYGALFDPEKNGVGAAFRKFGKDTQAAFEEVGRRFEKAFDPNQNGMTAAFEQFAKVAEANLKQFGQDFVDKCRDPDMWVQVITIMAQVAGGILAAAIAVGTLGAGTGLAIGLGMALNAVGPAVKMIADGARGRPIDVLDIVSLAIACVPPVPGLGTVMGEGMQKAIKYGNYAATAGRIIVAGVQVGQVLGVVPSTCIHNCPPPEVFPGMDDPEDAALCGGLTSEEIWQLQPDDESYPHMAGPDGKRMKNPKFRNQDAFEAEYRAKNCPVSKPATPATKVDAATDEEDIDLGDMEGMDDMGDMEGMDDMGDMEGMEDMGDMESMEDMEGMEDMGDMEGMEDMGDMEGMDDMEGMEDMEEPEEEIVIEEPEEEVVIEEPEEEVVIEEPEEEIELEEPEEEIELEKPMTAKEFMGEPKPMTAKEFMKEPVIMADNKPIPKQEVNNIKAEQFLAPSESTPVIPTINIPKPEPIQQIQRPPPRPMTAKEFLNAPAKSVEPLNIQSIIQPTIEIKSSKKLTRKKKYYTPADFGFYNIRRGGAEASIDDAIAVEPTADPRVYVNPYSNETATIENKAVPNNADGTVFNPECYAKNYPDMAKALDGDMDKITTWWVDKGYDAGDDATCGTFILDPELRVQMINNLKARETVCGTAGLYWDSKEQKCDESRNTDGSKNVAFQKCKRRNGYFSNNKCDLMRNQSGEFDAYTETGDGKLKSCSARGDFTDITARWGNRNAGESTCDASRNIDGTIKTKSDACTTSNNYWDVDEEKCDFTRDTYGDLKTEKDVCEFGGNYWDGSSCDINRTVNGEVKSDVEICLVNKRGDFKDGQCTRPSKEYPTTLSKMDEYVNATFSASDAKNKVISDLKIAKDLEIATIKKKHETLYINYKTAINDFTNLQKYIYKNKSNMSLSKLIVLDRAQYYWYPACQGTDSIEDQVESAIKYADDYYMKNTLPKIKALDPKFLETFNLPADELDIIALPHTVVENLMEKAQVSERGKYNMDENWANTNPRIASFNNDMVLRLQSDETKTDGLNKTKYSTIRIEIRSQDSGEFSQPSVKIILLCKRKKLTIQDFKEYIKSWELCALRNM